MKENNKDITYFVLGLIACLAMIVLSIMSIVTRIKSLKNNTYSNTNTSNVQNEILNPLFNSKDDEEGNVQTSKEINVLPTLLDKVSTNSAWCGTFQLVWNDMQNEVVGKDIEFDPQIAMVENLNKQSFKEKDISQDYYYKIWGLKTKRLKETIEKGIKEKFNQKSDVIDLIDWDGVPLDDSSYTGNDKEYIFYAMLYRQFNFEKEFTVLNKADFNGTGKKYNDVEYFGIDNTTDETVYNQINALYYNSEEDFAVMLKTKEGDEVLLSKGKNGTTFEEIYNNVVKKSEAYEGNKAFTEDDTFKGTNNEMNFKNDTFKNIKVYNNNITFKNSNYNDNTCKNFKETNSTEKQNKTNLEEDENNLTFKNTNSNESNNINNLTLKNTNDVVSDIYNNIDLNNINYHSKYEEGENENLDFKKSMKGYSKLVSNISKNYNSELYETWKKNNNNKNYSPEKKIYYENDEQRDKMINDIFESVNDNEDFNSTKNKNRFLDFTNTKVIDENNINENDLLDSYNNDLNNSTKKGTFNYDYLNEKNFKDNTLSSTIKVNEVLKNIKEDSSDDENDNNKISFLQETKKGNLVNPNIKQNRHLDLFETKKNKK